MPFGYRKRPVKAVVSDVTLSRAIDGTIYQNTSGRPILAIIATLHSRVSAVAAYATVIFHCDSATPPTTEMNRSGLGSQDNNAESVHGLSVLAVPNQYYYKATQNDDALGSASVLDTWIEVEL